MPIKLALPADIARFTVDGVLLERVSPQLHLLFANATDDGEDEIEMFFDAAADGELLLAERWAILSYPGRLHEAVEVAERIELDATAIATGALPQFNVTDASRSITTVAIGIAVSFDMTTDRYSVELAGARRDPVLILALTFDALYARFDTTAVKWDNSE